MGTADVPPLDSSGFPSLSYKALFTLLSQPGQMLAIFKAQTFSFYFNQVI